MRFVLLCSIALGANTAIASVCKPRQSSDTSVVPVEATTSTASEHISPTSTELETTGDATSAIIIATSDITVTTAESFTSSVTLPSEDESTTGSVTTDPSFASTETTTAAAHSLQTFQVIAPGHNLQDEYLVGRKITSQSMGFDLVPHADIPILTFTIEAETSFVREADGKYWCIEYSAPYSPGHLQLCDKDNLGNGRWSLLTCEQMDGRSLECSVPAASCGFNMNTGQVECNSLEGDFTQFYLVGNGNQNGYTLALGSKDHPPSGDYYTAVEVEVTQVRT
ncbi:pisatin demethylase [Fusarium sporotrichioides]|uniref:Pisatin demethylase n=1 Tax=Fusarium sporotrichioides TaxID=5514 RepID=A0A395SCR6_FUSSP|nr:pisatin demethylase [Fusarium sporotrichioides]